LAEFGVPCPLGWRQAKGSVDRGLEVGAADVGTGDEHLGEGPEWPPELAHEDTSPLEFLGDDRLNVAVRPGDPLGEFVGAADVMSRRIDSILPSRCLAESKAGEVDDDVIPERQFGNIKGCPEPARDGRRRVARARPWQARGNA